MGIHFILPLYELVIKKALRWTLVFTEDYSLSEWPGYYLVWEEPYTLSPFPPDFELLFSEAYSW